MRAYETNDRIYSQSLTAGMGPLSTEGEGQKSDFPPRVVLPYELRTFYFHSWVALISYA